MAALDKAGVEISRKQLSEMAARDPGAFEQLIAVARETVTPK
ncbi:MAG: hypothetical protein ACYDEA_12040 [Candidatus Dormibacteria bacterium]